MEDAIFYFKVTSSELKEPMYIDVTVEAITGEGETLVEGVPAGKYTVEEIDIPITYLIISEKYITQYVIGEEMEFVFENKLLPQTTPTITVEPSPTPSPSPSQTPSESPSPTPSETPTEIPTEKPTEKPTIPPDIPPEIVEHIVDIKEDEDGIIWYKLDTIPVIKIPETQPQPQQNSEWVTFEIDEYKTALGGQIVINHVGDSFD